MLDLIEITDKDQRSKSISKREQSIGKKLSGKLDNAVQIAFTFYVIAIAAKLARIDTGSFAESTSAEVDSFKEIFSIPESELDKVDEFYNEAVKDNIPATHYAKQLLNLFPNNRFLFEELVYDLLIFADADGPMTIAKVSFLKSIVLALDFNELFFGKVLRKYLLTTNADPFALLDASRNISHVELKKKYRNAIKDWHPDHFSGNNAVPELAQLASEQISIYTAAYEAIKLELGFGRK